MRVAGIVLVGTTAGCLCENEVRSIVPSPDGRLQAVPYSRDCGATTGDSVHISILSRGRLPGDEEANVLSADAGHDPNVSLDVKVTWETPTRLIVEIDPKVRFFRRHQRVRDVEVVYKSPQRRLR